MDPADDTRSGWCAPCGMSFKLEYGCICAEFPPWADDQTPAKVEEPNQLVTLEGARVKQEGASTESGHTHGGVGNINSNVVSRANPASEDRLASALARLHARRAHRSDINNEVKLDDPIQQRGGPVQSRADASSALLATNAALPEGPQSAMPASSLQRQPRKLSSAVGSAPHQGRQHELSLLRARAQQSQAQSSQHNAGHQRAPVPRSAPASQHAIGFWGGPLQAFQHPASLQYAQGLQYSQGPQYPQGLQYPTDSQYTPAPQFAPGQQYAPVPGYYPEWMAWNGQQHHFNGYGQDATTNMAWSHDPAQLESLRTRYTQEVAKTGGLEAEIASLKTRNTELESERNTAVHRCKMFGIRLELAETLGASKDRRLETLRLSNAGRMKAQMDRMAERRRRNEDATQPKREVLSQEPARKRQRMPSASEAISQRQAPYDWDRRGRVEQSHDDQEDRYEYVWGGDARGWYGQTREA